MSDVNTSQEFHIYWLTICRPHYSGSCFRLSLFFMINPLWSVATTIDIGSLQWSSIHRATIQLIVLCTASLYEIWFKGEPEAFLFLWRWVSNHSLVFKTAPVRYIYILYFVFFVYICFCVQISRCQSLMMALISTIMITQTTLAIMHAVLRIYSP
jgi:hypothetical protein